MSITSVLFFPIFIVLTVGFSLAASVSRPRQLPPPRSPKQPARLPAIVLVPGSGPVDRDETVGGIPIFGELASALADAGFLASFRTSITVALATAILATITGTMAAMGLMKLAPRSARSALLALSLPVLLPPLVGYLAEQLRLTHPELQVLQQELEASLHALAPAQAAGSDTPGLMAAVDDYRQVRSAAARANMASARCWSP